MKDIERELMRAAQNARSNGMSIAELSRQAGLPYATVHGFVENERCITLKSATAIARVLGLELQPSKTKRKGG